MLQPEPQSDEGCNTATLSHEGLANVNTCIRKRMLYRHCYTPSFQAVPNNFIQLYDEMSTDILSTNVDLRSLETEFLIAVCRPTVNYS